MGHFNAGTLNGKPVSFLTTVHGPSSGYGRVHGRTVAITSKRSSRGKDVLDQLFFRRLSNGSIKNPKDFFKAASLTPQTFNSFYIDSKHIAEYTSGRLPIRNPNVDPGLPTKGTGQYEWRGFVKAMDHIHGKDNKQGYITNWNNGTVAASAPPTTSGARTPRCSGQPAQFQPEAPPEEGEVVTRNHHLGDERSGDPGRARDRHGPRARQAAARIDAALAAGGADGRAS